MPHKASDGEDLPLMWKLFLKFPKLSLEGFSNEFQGIFWILIVPIFMVGDIFMNLLILTWLPFPANYITVVGVTTFIVLFFVRIYVERALNTTSALRQQGHFRWSIDTALKSYFQILQKKKKSNLTEIETSHKNSA